MWIELCSICICISLGMSLIFCLCWKKKNPKEEWIGVDGMVTPKNPDENVNNVTSPVSCIDEVTNEDAVDNNSKRNTVTNTRRSLPDIPSEMEVAINWETNGDNTSELYATLGQYQNDNNKVKLVSTLKAQPSISEHSSIGQTDDSFSPYERVKYDKIKSKEHPYAQVQPPGNRNFEEDTVNNDERLKLLRVANLSSGHNDLNAPSTSRASSSASANNDRIEVMPSTSAGIGVAVAAAVGGSVHPVNYDLNYMPSPPSAIQPNFSGDSQDSSKGYTSISVREPLANILAQTKQKKRLDDVHYSTVSDDSDDVYTTIPDTNANPIYTSESETYSKIGPLPPTAEIDINNPSNENRDNEEIDLLYEPPPPPPPPLLPSVDSLKHVASCSHSHSRQASSSSIPNLNSPKPEKRQANSPLPPPPPSSSSQISTVHNLDDLYAKVYKNKKEDFTDDRLSDRSFGDSLRNSIILSKTLMNEKSSEKMEEHNYYEKLRDIHSSNYAGYEKIKGGLNHNNEPGYASINEPDSLISNISDSGYEVLRNRAPSETNYEELIHHRLSNTSDSGYSKIKGSNSNGYSTIEDKKKIHHQYQIEEPNYESVPSSEIGEPNYAALTNSHYNDNDPNYESVERVTSKYENVGELKRSYNQSEDITPIDSSLIRKLKNTNNMQSDDSNTSSASRTLDESEPSYERLRDESASSDYEKEKDLKCGNMEQYCSSSSSSTGINGINVIQEKYKDSVGNQYNSV